MELVQSFAPVASNPFDGKEAEAPAAAAPAATADWDALPHDVRGLILDYVAAGSVVDFVSLSSCSRAWRYAAESKAQAAPELQRLRAAWAEERSFERRDKRQRRQVFQRAFGRKVRAHACYVVTLLLTAAFGLACVAGAAAGMHVLFTAGSPLVPPTPNCTAAAPNVTCCTGAANVTCCTAGQAEPLRGSAFAVSFFWIFYGSGFAILAVCGLYVELNVRRREAYGTTLDIFALGVSILLIFLGFLGLFAIAPAWHYLGAVPRVCVDPSYRASYQSFIVAATGLFFFFFVCEFSLSPSY